eukprot:521335_1
MDFGELQLVDAPDNMKQERRRSFVHDVKPEDNQVSYGQPDNSVNEINNGTMRISSIDDDTDQKRTTRLNSMNSDSHQSDDNDDQNGVFIHENVDNNYDEYGNDQIVDDYSQNEEEQAAARGSKETTPETNKNNKNNKNNTFDTSHYRHPSLGPNENPASDDEDLDKDHGRYLSTLIHENVDSDYEMTPSDDVMHSQNDLFSKNISRLHDYWCHSSSGIAIEDDTDAKLLRDKENNNNAHINHNVKESFHEINNYTRPFMSKIDNNGKWDTVFGNGIISDTHEKYIKHENGQFIEWIIEIQNIDNIRSKINKSTCIIGISSDLLGETNNDSFISVINGYGFDNLGNIYNNNNNNNNKIIEQKYDPLSSDPITDLNGVLDEKNKNIDHNLDLLSFRISTIPATDYALRVIELCQLSYIYNNEKLKSFFEWFIRFAVQTFIEITYAHTCFTTQNINAINNEINKLKSIQFIAQLVILPQPNDNKLNFDKMLYDYLTIIVSYLELLPSNNNNIMSNNNIDHEYVIFHVARYLTSNFIFAQDIISQNEEQNIPDIAQKKVYQWINIILQSTKSKLKYSNDYNKIVNKTNKTRNIIKATKYDSIARIRPARAAAIVMDYVYNIHVHG